MKLLWQNVKKCKKIDNGIYEACESTCHECSAKDKLENDIEDSVVEDADLFKKKDMENKKIMREKENMKIGSPQYESSEKAIEVDNEFRLNVDEQKDDKKTFKVTMRHR